MREQPENLSEYYVLDGMNREDKKPPYQASYPSEFMDFAFKDTIRRRDSRICQLCGTKQSEHKVLYRKKLSIHHIDYDKDNLDENNLITLCQPCNCKVNFDRRNWRHYFEIKQRGYK